MMGLRMSATHVKTEDDIGSNRPLPGRYHAYILDVDESYQDSDKIIIDFHILAGTVPGQSGKTVREYFAITDKAMPRLQRLALVTGQLAPGEGEKNVQFVESVGRHLVIEVEENIYTNKDGKKINGVRISYVGMWSVGNKEVEDVPKDLEALQLTGNQQPTATPTSAPAPVVVAGQPAAAVEDKWANL